MTAKEYIPKQMTVREAREIVQCIPDDYLKQIFLLAYALGSHEFREEVIKEAGNMGVEEKDAHELIDAALTLYQAQPRLVKS